MLLVLQKLGVNSVLDDVVQDVSNRCPSIDLPWLNTEIGLANIQQKTVEKCARLDDRCEQPVDTGSNQSDKFVTSTGKETSKVAAASCRQVTDYSHLYVYKKNASLTASRSQKKVEYIALSSSSSSSDDDESGSRHVDVADVGSFDDALSTVTVADNARTTSIHGAKCSKLYRSPNTGVQIANPNKKRNKKRS